MISLSGRTCVIAGGTGNIGYGAVRELAAGGMNVVMVTHDMKKAKDICEEFKELPGKVMALGNDDGDDKVFDVVREKLGSVDVVISNTGGMDLPVALGTLTREKLNEKLAHQVTEPFMMIQAAIPHLKDSRAGRIILTSTAGALNGFEGESLTDSIGRGGVISMTYCLAKMLMNTGITVNCIAKSGMINDHTPMTGRDLDMSSVVSHIPMGTLGTSEEFGALVAYIASEESAFVTGQIFNLSGGLNIG